MKDQKISKAQNLKGIQSVSLDIYKQIKRVCEDNDIRFFAIGGTAIGAARHKGFIPWDDDIDIAMPREDFNKFSKIAPKQLPEYYRVSDNTLDPTSPEMAMRVDDTRTTMTTGRVIYKKDTSLYRGVMVDVMPLDGVPSNYVHYRIHRMLLRTLYNLNYVANQKNSFSWSPKNIILTAGSALLAPFNRRGFFNREFHKLNSRFKFDDSAYLARTWWFTSHDGMQTATRYHKEDFSNAVEMSFEDTVMRMPVGYDRYLSSLYPSYMTPPPKEKQVPHYFDGIIDLNNSFTYHIAVRDGKRIGYTAGCYDLFHIGHMNLLRRAKEACDYLIVGVNSDEAMYSYKKKRPVIPEDERVSIVRGLRCVDEVVLVTDTDKYEAYKKHKYDVIFVGDDHKGEPKWVELEKKLAKKGSRVHYFGYTKHISSSKLRENLKK